MGFIGPPPLELAIIFPDWLEDVYQPASSDRPAAMRDITGDNYHLAWCQGIGFIFYNEFKLTLKDIGNLLVGMMVFWKGSAFLHLPIDDGHLFAVDELGVISRCDFSWRDLIQIMKGHKDSF
jgi:hypothetical protein